MARRFKHLTETDRIKIEAYLRVKMEPREIADKIGVHPSTVYRELKRGRYKRLDGETWIEYDCYSPDIAQARYRENLRAKGAQLKIGRNREFADYIERKILNERYSPYAALASIAREGLEFGVTICVRTLYSYIEKGIFLKLTNKNLPERGKQKRKYHHVRPARAPKGESIEKRPQEIDDRTTFGNWEMDTVKGKQGTKHTLLVLTERLTRQEVTVKMADGTAESVVRALDALERRWGEGFKRVFKTITVDNGSEFSRCEEMERGLRLWEGKRTKLYYCHPYSSYERGSNENQNRMIRRWIPKGVPIDNYSDEEVEKMQDWMNNYPRLILGGKASADLFAEHVAALGVRC